MDASHFEFVAWPKIPRLKAGGVTITEKLDGTNAQIFITRLGEGDLWVTPDKYCTLTVPVEPGVFYVVQAGSRSRWIGPNDMYGKGSDNYGFAAWVWMHADVLVRGLGVGRHYGEWYGQGIQRAYGLDEKRFALFNTGRWGEHNPPPACCEVVPVLASGVEPGDVEYQMARLCIHGSAAVPGFTSPEGVVVYNHATKTYSKETFENSNGKWTT